MLYPEATVLFQVATHRTLEGPQTSRARFVGVGWRICQEEEEEEQLKGEPLLRESAKEETFWTRAVMPSPPRNVLQKS